MWASVADWVTESDGEDDDGDYGLVTPGWGWGLGWWRCRAENINYLPRLTSRLQAAMGNWLNPKPFPKPTITMVQVNAVLKLRKIPS